MSSVLHLLLEHEHKASKPVRKEKASMGAAAMMTGGRKAWYRQQLQQSRVVATKSSSQPSIRRSGSTGSLPPVPTRNGEDLIQHIRAKQGVTAAGRRLLQAPDAEGDAATSKGQKPCFDGWENLHQTKLPQGLA
eukprot:TRINITY_DN5922_c0_g2_i1.p1 TRINITY_DN5922_c0_g2~~TRINITY_DN5922_c0_g2_i1.p1  ORF type:complete len:134 (-),score=24.53 TRINITY_DN5922_c0_g2_i1:149-550(-)